MLVSELIDKLQRIAFKDQEIFVSINDGDGYDIVGLTEENAVFIDVYDEEKENSKMTAIEIRDLIDDLIREHGKEKVIITIESILNFYKEKKEN